MFANGLIVTIGALAAGGAIFLWFLWASSSAEPEVTSNDNATEPEEEAAFERKRQLIYSLLMNLTNEITSLLGSAQAYDKSLASHRGEIERAGNLDTIKEVEALLLSELDAMRKDTERYRTELAEARKQIEQQQEELETARHEAGEDPVTKIPNRRTFDKRFAEETARATRYRSPLSLLLIDLDHFKAINDEHGHVAGDRVLASVAQILNTMRRQSDFLARYGGEEFCMVLPQTNLSQATEMAQRAAEQIGSSKFVRNGNVIKVTCSIGVAEFDRKNDTEETLLGRADKALYAAKEGGRNRVMNQAVRSSVGENA